MKAVALALSIGLFASSPALATHGNPIPHIAKQRAKETCTDVKFGAPRKWALKKNIMVGVLSLAQVSGKNPNDLQQSTVKRFANEYKQSLDNLCQEVLDYEKNNKGTLPSNSTYHRT